MTEPNSQLLIYQTPDGVIKIDVRLESETVWLTQTHMAELFNKDKRTISEHIRNIFNEGELAENSVVRNFRLTAYELVKLMKDDMTKRFVFLDGDGAVVV